MFPEVVLTRYRLWPPGSETSALVHLCPELSIPICVARDGVVVTNTSSAHKDDLVSTYSFDLWERIETDCNTATTQRVIPFTYEGSTFVRGSDA
jgi:hypothetical protein